MVEIENIGSVKCEDCGCPVFYIIFFKEQAYTICQKCGAIAVSEFFSMKNEEEFGGGTA